MQNLAMAIELHAESNSVRKTFTITADKDTMRRFEEFLALITQSSAIGHSNMFGMSVDGDGADRISCEPKCKFAEGRGPVNRRGSYESVGDV
jgi:hypothetical protein